MSAAVVGFDLSLTATGIADDHGERCIGADATTDLTSRLRLMSEQLDDALDGCELAVVEDLPRNPRFGGVALGMVHACFRLALLHHDIPVLWPTPATLKLYATGSGNAGKPEMMAAAIRRLGYGGHDHNEADAMWLRALGLHVIGAPLCELPAKNLTALAKLNLPAGMPVG